MDFSQFKDLGDDAELPAGWRCDFCGQSPPVWVFPTRTHDVYKVESVEGPSVTGQSVGGWLACRDCQIFIDRMRENELIDQERLARRCATIIATKLHLSQKAVLTDIRPIHQGFFQQRLGAGRPWTAAVAQDPPPPPFEVKGFD